MKTLILFRHGKSDWNAGVSSDHARPLNRRGVAAARTMGRLLADMNQVPEQVISSTAVRAATTARLAMEAGRWDADSVQDRRLYASTPQAVLQLIHELPNTLDSVMLVGHEPTWSGLVASLTGGQVRMPTAAMAGMRFHVPDWADLGLGRGELLWLLPPRLLQSAFDKGSS